MRMMVIVMMVVSMVTSGCCASQSAGKEVQGIGDGFSLIGKSIGDGAYNVWKAIEKADKWFEENYW